MAVARRLTPKEIIERDKRVAIRQSTIEGRKSLQKLLEKAESRLKDRFYKTGALRGAGEAQFTTAQAGVVMMQVREVLKELHAGMKKTIVQNGKKTATKATADNIKYINAAEKRFRGIAAELPLKTAMIVDRVNANTESSILHRIETDPKHPGRPGVLDRYDGNVIQQFEEEVALRLVARQPWAETRAAITEASPFLKGQPAYWAERIVRTETMHAHNRASWETMRAVNQQLGDMLKILSASFDDRTAADSYAVHGQIRRVDEPFESWFGEYMHPPNRPNDREVVVPHRMSWPLPAELEPMTDGDVATRWAEEGRKGAPPARPNMSTVDRKRIGKEEPPPIKGPKPPPPPPPPKPPKPKPPPPKPKPGKPEPAVKLTKLQRDIVTDMLDGGVLTSIQYPWMKKPHAKIRWSNGQLASISEKSMDRLRAAGLIDGKPKLGEKKVVETTWSLTKKGKSVAATSKEKKIAADKKAVDALKKKSELTGAKLGEIQSVKYTDPAIMDWGNRMADAADTIAKGVAKPAAMRKAKRLLREGVREMLRRDGFVENPSQTPTAAYRRNDVLLVTDMSKTGALASMNLYSKRMRYDRAGFNQVVTGLRKMAKGQRPNSTELFKLTALFHEEIHAHTHSFRRGGYNSAIEEVATETIARQLVRRIWGKGEYSYYYGGYQEELNEIFKIVTKHSKLPDWKKNETMDMVADASRKVRTKEMPADMKAGDFLAQRGDVINQVHEIVDAFPSTKVSAAAKAKIKKELTTTQWWPASRKW